MSTALAPRLSTWLAIAALVIVLDQATKTLILGNFALNDTHAITSFFNLTRHHNSGAAFSFLAGASGWQRWFFIVLGLVATGFIVWMLKKYPAQKLFCFAVTMIMGGALGNVVDFLQFRFALLEPIFRGGYFPTFNLADSAITLGAVLLIVDELRRVKRGG